MLAIVFIIFSMFLVYLIFCVQKNEYTVSGRFKGFVFKILEKIYRCNFIFLIFKTKKLKIFS